MSDSRERMVAALRDRVVPWLRARGFSGSFPHFRREKEGRLHLLTFQFDKWGGGFAVELGRCDARPLLLPSGEEIAPGRITTHHLPRRLRLGAASEDDDHWFRYEGICLQFWKDRHAQAAMAVLDHLDRQAEAWWAGR